MSFHIGVLNITSKLIFLYKSFTIEIGKDLIESKRKCNDSPSLSLPPSPPPPPTAYTAHKSKKENIVHVCNLTTGGLFELAVCSHEDYRFRYNKETPALGTFLE